MSAGRSGLTGPVGTGVGVDVGLGASLTTDGVFSTSGVGVEQPPRTTPIPTTSATAPTEHDRPQSPRSCRRPAPDTPLRARAAALCNPCEPIPAPSVGTGTGPHRPLPPQEPNGSNRHTTTPRPRLWTTRLHGPRAAPDPTTGCRRGPAATAPGRRPRVPHDTHPLDHAVDVPRARGCRRSQPESRRQPHVRHHETDRSTRPAADVTRRTPGRRASTTSDVSPPSTTLRAREHEVAVVRSVITTATSCSAPKTPGHSTTPPHGGRGRDRSDRKTGPQARPAGPAPRPGQQAAPSGPVSSSRPAVSADPAGQPAAPQASRRTRMREHSSQRATWSGLLALMISTSEGLSSRRHPSQRRPLSTAAPRPPSCARSRS
ncbi:hypothetical protein ABIC85_000657 [Oerskovia enterophila]